MLLTWLCNTIEFEYSKPEGACETKQNVLSELNYFGGINIATLCYDSTDLFVPNFFIPNLHLSFFSSI
jgi:hypothetical protein